MDGISSILPFAFCAGLAIAASFYAAPDIAGAFGALLAVLMAAIAHEDAQRFIIPDHYSAAALFLGFAAIVVIEDPDRLWLLGMATLRAVALASCFVAVRVLYARLRGRHGLGLGDVKLAAVAGAWLDWTTLPIAIEIAALAALTAVLLRQLITRERLTATARLPFGLFLAPSIWIGWWLQTALPGP